MRLRLLLPLLFLLPAFAACTNDSAGRAGPASGEPLPPSVSVMLRDVSALRELPPPAALKVNIVPRSGVVDLLDRLTTDEDREWFARTTTLYRLLGHIADSQDYLSIYRAFGGVAILGVYSPQDKALWVVHDGANLDDLSKEAKETLAHELVHALQDARFDLEKQYKDVAPDLDADLAWTALVEGDANTHEQLYSEKYLALPVGPGAGRAFLVAKAEPQAGVPQSIVRELLFPYTTGADWVRDIRASGGTKAIDALFGRQPLATAYVLHPELLGSGWKPETVKLPDLAPVLGSGWTKESGGVFGEFSLRNWLQTRIKAGDAATAAAGWTGDQYAVYVNGDKSLAAFRVRFKDETEAREFVTAQRQWFDAGRATVTEQGGYTSWVQQTGKTAVSTQARGNEVIFVLARGKDSAAKAIEAILKG